MREIAMKRVPWSLFLCLVLASCSAAPGGDHPAYPTKGKVLVNGKPAAGACVKFFHSGDWDKEKVIVPSGWTNAEGQFVLSTYSQDDGAPEGDYRVTVEWPAYRRGREWGPDKLSGKYDMKSETHLVARIEKDTGELKPFELEGKVIDVDIKDVQKAKREKRSQGSKR
jgi:hypothetical protein